MSNNFPPPPPSSDGKKKVAFGKIQPIKGRRIGIYGTGGIGKSTLAAQAPGLVAFYDFDESLPMISSTLRELNLLDSVRIVPTPKTFSELRLSLGMEGWEGINSVVIDSLTKVEELIISHVLATIKMEGGKLAPNIEAYGWGKGYRFLYEQFILLLNDLEKHFYAGRNVIVICHDCVSNAPNPSGENFLRHEPRLKSSSKGENDCRAKLKEWLDDLVFIDYDIAVSKEHKATGSRTRTVYGDEYPFCLAKTRPSKGIFGLDEKTDFWSIILNKQ